MAKDELKIGLTQENLNKTKRSYNFIESYERRKNRLRFFCNIFSAARINIIELQSRVGDALIMDFECMVMSIETFLPACRINCVRNTMGKKPVDIVTCPLIGQKNVKMSSYLLREKECDK